MSTMSSMSSMSVWFRSCRSLVLLLCVGVTLTSCGRKETPPVQALNPDVDPAFVDNARVSANRMRVELQKELRAAMESGGPTAAVVVCSERAAVIAAEVSAVTDLDLHRVSTRNRSPLGRANAVEAAVLAEFERRPAFTDTAFVDAGVPTYMRAIRIDSPACLVCHGPVEELAPEVQAVLASTYPEDRATGFAVGDLRGAFVVR